MRVLVLTGPTGVGKTEVAAELARRHSLELISADSRQVYSWLDIGTAKPDKDLRSEIPFHMVDRVDPKIAYSAADYARDATAVMRRLVREGKRFMMVGGSGLYIRAVFEPFFDAPKPNPDIRKRLEQESLPSLYARLKQTDPERAARLHPNDRQRIVRALEIRELTGRTMTELEQEAHPKPEFTPVYVVLSIPRPRLHQQIDERFDRMMEAGLLDEVRQLKEAGLGTDSPVADAYGYAELLLHLDGKLDLAAAVAGAKTKTRAYAKRQLSWFRSLKGAHWIEHEDTGSTADRLESLIGEMLTGVAG